MLEVEVWVKVNASGEYEVGADEDAAKERFTEAECDESEPARLVRMLVKVPAPRPIEVTVEVPDDESDAERTATVTAG
jgi:hypothetical protein